MRFRRSRRLWLTAFALAGLLSYSGCSSQQQQASEEVAAEDTGESDNQAENSESENSASADQAAPAEGQAEASNPAAENGTAGSEVVSNEAEAATNGAANGDLQEIISEMNGNMPSSNATPNSQVADAAPTNQAAAPTTESVATNSATATSAPVVGALPEQGSKMPYVVEAGDTLGKIASKVFGDQKRWRDIANLSGLDNPNHIYPGDVIYFNLDETSRNFASNYDQVKRSKETVRQGDTLAAISKRVYGNSKFWKHIWRQNDQIDNPDKLTAGMTVYYVEQGAVKSALKNPAKKSLTVSKSKHKTFGSKVSISSELGYSPVKIMTTAAVPLNS